MECGWLHGVAARKAHEMGTARPPASVKTKQFVTHWQTLGPKAITHQSGRHGDVWVAPLMWPCVMRLITDQQHGDVDVHLMYVRV